MSSSSNSVRLFPNVTALALQGQAITLSEEASHREHCAALEATLFRRDGEHEELVFELDGGRLRMQGRRR